MNGHVTREDVFSPIIMLFLKLSWQSDGPWSGGVMSCGKEAHVQARKNVARLHSKIEGKSRACVIGPGEKVIVLKDLMGHNPLWLVRLGISPFKNLNLVGPK